MAEINETLVNEILDSNTKISPELNSQQGNAIVIKDYDKQVNELTSWLTHIDSLVPIEISTRDENILAKNLRAALNKRISLINRARIDFLTDFTAKWNDQCNILTSMIKEVEIQIAQKIKSYEDSQTVGTLPKPKTTKVTLKFFENEKILKKLEKFCLDNNIEMKVEVK